MSLHMKLKTILSALFFAVLFSGLLFPAKSGAEISLNEEDAVQIVRDFSSLMNIPDITALAASDTHIYALSESDGLVVFRVHADSLQWLYSSEGMQRRGNRLTADVRFAYLAGDDNRLTIVEPTSVLGVYSSTQLPAKPLHFARNGDNLYLAMEKNGLFRLSLSSPESVDSDPEEVASDRLGNRQVTGLTIYEDQMLVLTRNGDLLQFDLSDDEPRYQRSFSFNTQTNFLALVDGSPVIGTANGQVNEITSSGDLRNLFRVPGSLDKLVKWEGHFFARTDEGRIITYSGDSGTQTHRDDPEAGNLLAMSRSQLWMTEFSQVARMQISRATRQAPAASGETPSGRLSLKNIDNQVISYPRPLLLPLLFEEPFPVDKVSFQIQSSNPNARIQDNGFFWRPGSRDIGVTRFTIIATSADGQSSSQSFSVEVRPFNAPPRFNPVRPLSIPVGEEFELPVRATDPDGTDPDLIRYIGVNLPDGATIDERSGMLKWVPQRRQTGEHEFQVIATDQFGAAASLTIKINVLELTRGN